jgi:hypothetical protein
MNTRKSKLAQAEAAPPMQTPEVQPLPDNASPPSSKANGADTNAQAAPVMIGDMNIDDFGLDQSFESAHTEKLLTSTTMPHLFKVPPEWYFQVHPDPDMHFEATLLVVEKDKVLKGEYLLLPGLEAGLSPSLIKPVSFVLAINRRGDHFIWALKVPNPENEMAYKWNKSVNEAANDAKGRWVKIITNQALSGYEVYPARADLGRPRWHSAVTTNPDGTPKPAGRAIREFVVLSFQGSVIKEHDDPVLEQLLGLK